MKKTIKKHSSKKSLVVLSVIFLILFFLKASWYGLVGDVFFYDWLLKFIPEYILFYIFVPIYFIFQFPMGFILGKVIPTISNDFIVFTLDISLTVLYLTTLYFIFRKIIYFFKRTKKSI